MLRLLCTSLLFPQEITAFLSRLMHPSRLETFSSLPVRWCPSNRPQFIGTPEMSANDVILVWDDPYIMDPLVFDPRYAVHTMCDRDAALMLQYYNGNYNWTLQTEELKTFRAPLTPSLAYPPVRGALPRWFCTAGTVTTTSGHCDLYHRS